MDNTNFLIHGLDKDLKPLPNVHKDISQAQYYKATFTPTFPPIPQFHPNQYICASLTEDSISVIGRHNTAKDFYQLNIIIPRHLASGEYDVVLPGEDVKNGVNATVVANGKSLYGRNGRVKFEKNKALQIIDATFHYEIGDSGTVFKVAGRLSLLATGPL